ncbi:MAG: riboflavin synthase [Phycisphaerae bacterium]|nr:riboflavin synthase [Phycisphaerae bacterium]
MFTGIIEITQPVIAIAASPIGKIINLDLGFLAEDARVGDSIAVNGVCLTISKLQGTKAHFDVMAETLKVSTLGHLAAGDRVNLERAMAADGRFGGHIVQGHVDGIGSIESIDKQNDQYIIWVKADARVIANLIDKGSVAIDGISLTVISVQKDKFNVSLIPTTLHETTLQNKKNGDKVNLEADIISKMINKRLDTILAGEKSSNLSINKLREMGF